MAWYTYDLGNTTIEFAVPLYLTLWLVNDLGVSAWLFGLASAASSWAIGLSGPYIGVNADETHTRREWFAVSALVATVLFGSLCFLPHVGTQAVLSVLGVAMAAAYFFQLSSLIYNASMLNAAKGANVVSVSSVGLALSYLGGIAGVGIIEAVVSGHVVRGWSGRIYAMVPAAVIFAACAVPSIFTPGLWQTGTAPVSASHETLHRRMWELWKEASRDRLAGRFLAGYFALNSAIMGLTLYLPLHVQTVTGLTGTAYYAVFVAVVLTGTVGAGIVAFLRPTGPMVRRIILVATVLLAVNAVMFSLVTTQTLVIVFACLHGFFGGVLTPTLRGAFAQTFRSDYQGLAFGLFGAAQRLSQGLGALLWPLTVAGVGRHATGAGIAAMGALALIGIPFFSRWRLCEPPPHDANGDEPPAATDAPGAEKPAGGASA